MNVVLVTQEKNTSIAVGLYNKYINPIITIIVINNLVLLLNIMYILIKDKKYILIIYKSKYL